MGDTRKRRREMTSISKIRVKDPRPLHGIAENLFSLQQDLEIARRIQSRLLPPRPEIAPYDIDCFYQPAGQVGGDFYDFLPMPDGRLGMLVADASGKGLAGALLMVEARAMIRAMASMSGSPREILTAVNRVLLRDLEKGRFVTAFLAMLDPKAHTLTVANAGHTPMLLCREVGQAIVSVQPKGLVLGVVPDARFTSGIEEETLNLFPGDRFLLYSDGVTELMNPVAEEYGAERLEAFLKKNAHLWSEDVIQALTQALEHHQAGQAQSDDITIVTGRLVP